MTHLKHIFSSVTQKLGCLLFLRLHRGGWLAISACQCTSPHSFTFQPHLDILWWIPDFHANQTATMVFVPVLVTGACLNFLKQRMKKSYVILLPFFFDIFVHGGKFGCLGQLSDVALSVAPSAKRALESHLEITQGKILGKTGLIFTVHS